MSRFSRGLAQEHEWHCLITFCTTNSDGPITGYICCLPNMLINMQWHRWLYVKCEVNTVHIIGDEILIIIIKASFQVSDNMSENETREINYD